MRVSKNVLLLLIFSLFILLGSGCRVHQHHPQYHKKGMIIGAKPTGKLPPGQVKKAMGAKSAKAFAHGQNKADKPGPNKAHKYNKPHKYNKGNKRR